MIIFFIKEYLQEHTGRVTRAYVRTRAQGESAVLRNLLKINHLLFYWFSNT